MHTQPTRRGVLGIGSLGLLLALAACGGGITLSPPPATGGDTPDPQAIGGIGGVVSEATSILDKADAIRQQLSADAGAIIDKGRALAAAASGAGGSVSTASSLITTVAGLAQFLPPPYGQIATAITTLVPLMNGMLGIKMSPARTGMSVAQARLIIRSR